MGGDTQRPKIRHLYKNLVFFLNFPFYLINYFGFKIFDIYLHCLLLARPTAINSLRRNGFSPEMIMKISGHTNVDTLLKSYDHTLDPVDRVDMAVSIGLAPKLSRGEVQNVRGK